MNALILSAVLVLAQAPTPAPAAGRDANRDNTPMSINGDWTVICYEKDGKPKGEPQACRFNPRPDQQCFL